ncbi:MAG: helix-turn-helix domain-containing protein [Marinifilaceae bacterium]
MTNYNVINDTNTQRVTDSLFKYHELDEGIVISDDKLESYMLVFVMSGCLDLSSCDNQMIREYNEGDIFLLRMGCGYRAKMKQRCRVMFCAFNQRDLHNEEWCIRLNTLKETLLEERTHGITIGSPLNSFLNQLVSYRRDGVLSTFFQSVKQRELWLLFESYYNDEDLYSLFYPILGGMPTFKEKVLLYHRKARNAAELAELCGYGQRDFARKFNDCFNDSPYSWMIKQNAKYIKQEILADTPFKQIIYDYGFSSSAHFSQFCRKYLGDSPNVIRKNVDVALSSL